MVLKGKNVVLGITGSIACYKALDLASKLVQAGANVDVILSYGASQFITPLACRSLTHRPVVTDLFDPDSELSVEHVALANRADIVVVAPATAHFIAKMAGGLADDPSDDNHPGHGGAGPGCTRNGWPHVRERRHPGEHCHHQETGSLCRRTRHRKAGVRNVGSRTARGNP